MDLWKGVTDTVERYVPGAKLQVAKIADKAKVRRDDAAARCALFVFCVCACCLSRSLSL